MIMDHNEICRIASKISASSNVRTAGKIEFIRDQGPLRRDVRANDFEWSSDSLKNLAKILWAAQRAHSYSVSALRLFSKMPSSQFSPDGLLGGRGYIQPIKELRKSLSQASEVLSSFTDTLYDEINASHWSDSETEDSKNLLKNTEEVKDNPEAFVEEEYEAEGETDFHETSPSSLNPSPEDFQDEIEQPDEESDAEDSGGFSQQASFDQYPSFFKNTLAKQNGRVLMGTSSLPVSTLPGPRVEHIGPGESVYGWVNGPDAVPSDDPSLEGFITDQPIYEDVCADGVSGYENPTDGDNTYLKKASYSLLPGSENLKIMPFYDRNLTKADVEWLMANSRPDVPKLSTGEVTDSDTSWLWKDI